ncbi:hypothetical protein [Chelatococcus asaccharovorans]|uniref:hypothetical protein n=1 Tax=Chelatococcus asaccharovorans TaxID=28210 RepID=UPI0011B58576|nr:hypothetical protein [Chelatococcus asaccharovorans]MBS7702655.1 hypothetical protein [Chelatococcus asaccharovorans]
MHISQRSAAQHRAGTYSILDHRPDAWTPSRSRRIHGRVVLFRNDGPSSVPPPPANDNAARIEWPLGKALRADGNKWLLAIAAGYRHIDELSSAGGLLGKDIGESGFSIDQRTWVNPSGVIIYKGARRAPAK